MSEGVIKRSLLARPLRSYRSSGLAHQMMAWYETGFPFFRYSSSSSDDDLYVGLKQRIKHTKKNISFLGSQGSGKCSFSRQIAKAKSYFCLKKISPYLT